MLMNIDQQKDDLENVKNSKCGEIVAAPLLEHHPSDLLRMLILTSAISMLVIITLSTFGFYRIFSGFVIESAEEDSVDLCEVMIDEYRPFFFRIVAASDTYVERSDNAFRKIDQGLRRFLKPYQIVKIKVYNSKRKVVYSTDHKIIGDVDSDNTRLGNALTGKIDSRLEIKEKMRDLAEEEIINLDVVETYVPIKDQAGKIEGCFEVYQKVDKYRDQVWKGVFYAMGILFVVVLGVFSCAYILIKKVTDRLSLFHDYLGKIAVTDDLTGISNRGYLFKTGSEQFHRVQRNRRKKQPNAHLGCLMIDIDLFKSINDTKGHLVGDQIIRRVAERIQTGLRDYDLLARYGGEEFVALLPDTDFDTSRLVAERVWNCIREEAFDVDGESIMVTVSIGLSTFDDNDDDLNDILKRSDEALYKAKHGGRDKVEWI